MCVVSKPPCPFYRLKRNTKLRKPCPVLYTFKRKIKRPSFCTYSFLKKISFRRSLSFGIGHTGHFSKQSPRIINSRLIAGLLYTYVFTSPLQICKDRQHCVHMISTADICSSHKPWILPHSIQETYIGRPRIGHSCETHNS